MAPLYFVLFPPLAAHHMVTINTPVLALATPQEDAHLVMLGLLPFLLLAQLQKMTLGKCEALISKSTCTNT